MANLVASLVLRLIDQMSAPARGAAKSIQGVGEAQRSAGEGAKAWSRGADEARGKLDGLANPARAATRAADDLGRASRGAGAGLNGLDGRLGRVPPRARAAADALGRLNRAQKIGQDASKQWARGLDELDGKLGRLASASLVTDGIGRAGQSLMRPLRAATGVAIGYESQLAAIGDTADMSAERLANMDRAIARASRLGRRKTQIADAAAIYVAGGLDDDTAGALLETTTKLAIGARVSFEDAAKAAMAFNQNMKVTPDLMERAFDAAATSGKAGKFELNDMAQYLPSVGAIAARRGMKGVGGVAEVTAALTVIRDQVGESSEAATYMRDVLLKMDANETANNFDKFGINVRRRLASEQAAGKSALDAIMDITQEAMGKGAQLNQLFTDQQAQLGISALLDGRERFDEIRDAAAKASGVVQDSYDRMRATNAEKVESYAAALERAGAAAGKILAPAVGLAANLLERVANWMEAAGSSGSILAKAAVWAVAGFAGLAVTAGAVGQAMVGVLGPMLIMKSLFGTMGGAAVKAFGAQIVGALARARLAALAFNLTMLANPVVLAVAAAVAAVAVVALVVRKYWEPIKAFFGGVGQALGEAFGPALSAIGSALAPLKPLWDGVAGAVGGFFGWIGRLLQPMQATKGQLDSAASAGQRFGRLLVTAFNFTPIGLFVAAVKSGIDMVRSIMAFRPGEFVAGMARTWDRLTTVVGEGALGLLDLVGRYHPMAILVRNWSGITGALGRVWAGARTTVVEGVSGLLTLVGRYHPVAILVRNWSGITGALGRVWASARETVASGVRGAGASAINYLTGLPARFRTIGAQIVQGLVDGIRSGVAAVGQAAGNAGRAAVDTARRTLGIRSPSRVFAGIGGFTMQGLAQGLMRNTAAPLAAVVAMVGALAAAAPALALPVVLDTPPSPTGSVVVMDEGAPSKGPDVPPGGPGVPLRPGPPPAAGASAYAPAFPLAGLAPPAAASAPPPREVHHHHRYGDITIQMNGVTVTARDVARELARMQQAQRRGGLNDGDLS